MHFTLSLRSSCQLPGNKIPVYSNTLPALWIPKNKASGQRQHIMTRICVSRKQPITLGVAALGLPTQKAAFGNKETFRWNPE